METRNSEFSCKVKMISSHRASASARDAIRLYTEALELIEQGADAETTKIAADYISAVEHALKDGMERSPYFTDPMDMRDSDLVKNDKAPAA